MDELWAWVGYLASALVAYSLMQSQQKALRWWNLAGALLFLAYGLGIAAYPVAVVNAVIVVVNLRFLFKIYQFEADQG